MGECRKWGQTSKGTVQPGALVTKLLICICSFQLKFYPSLWRIFFLLKILFCFIFAFKYHFSVSLGPTCSFCPALPVDVLVQLHLCFLASRLWMRRGYEHELAGMPMLLHRRVCDFVVLQLWTIVDVLLTQASCGTQKYINKGKTIPCERPWRPIGLWDVEAPTFSRQSAHRWRWGW
jgi:hypothetical protein